MAWASRNTVWRSLGNGRNGRNGSHSRCGNGANINLGGDLAASILLRAVTGDVTSLAALVACLASGVEGTAVGGRAIARDVTKLAAGIALHGLGLAITSEVVGTSALVAGGRTRAAGKAATSAKATRVATTAHGGAATHGGADGVRACASKVTRLTTVVAATAGASASQTEGWAVSLDVAKTLAVVALLSLGSSGKRAAVRLVSRLLAVVAKALGRGADLGVVANIATLVAGATRERRHVDGVDILFFSFQQRGKF
jgi:hypothetical protein